MSSGATNPLSRDPGELDQVKALSDALSYYGWEVSVGEMEDGYVEVMAIDRRDTRSVRYVKYTDEEYTLFRSLFYLAQACGIREPGKFIVSAG